MSEIEVVEELTQSATVAAVNAQSIAQERPTQLSVLQMFSRSQISAFAATAVDFGLIFILTEVFSVWYVLATAFGTLLGGVTNFVLNRYWGFQAHDDRWGGQAYRYFFTSGLSMLLNSGGVYWVTESFKIHYGLSVVLVAIPIGVLVNFPLQRYWVFRK
jgi:putative flippase GtrA